MTYQAFLSSLSPHLFWDVDKTLFVEEKENEVALIIERAITHGLIDDWKLIVKRYGLEKIEAVTLKLRALDKVSLAFLCALFNRKKEEFRCYTHRQSHPNFWEY